MKLIKMLERLEYEVLRGDANTDVGRIIYDSRAEIKAKDVFICISGAVFNGHTYIDEVAKKGATAVIVEETAESYPEGLTVILVKSTRYAMALMSAAYFDYPAEKLKVIGITGTKGKTTTSYMVHSILNSAGIKCGLIGTIEAIIGDEKIPSSHSTPESYVLQELFNKMVKAGMECVVMEVSSQGLMLDRVAGINFYIGVFTNIEPDHISPHEHPNFEHYLNCKRMLLQRCGIGLVNRDDRHFESMIESHTCKIETYGMSEMADFKAGNTELKLSDGIMGVEFDVSASKKLHVFVGIPGKFTIYNALVAIAICRHLGADEAVMLEALRNVKVKGRSEPVRVSDEFTVMIDYAHNAMSLKSFLTAIKEYNPKRLVCVFGCGGNRSKDRRFEMGEISSELADLTVVTSDNPRFEEPLDIIADIIVGVERKNGKYVSIPDRGEAIKYCLENALPGDVIVVAGKGHEDYQEIKGVKYHMDDRELVINAAKELKMLP